MVTPMLLAAFHLRKRRDTETFVKSFSELTPIMSRLMYRIVQPYGKDKAREATIVSEHASAAEAFAEIDRLSAQMVRTGAPSDAVELFVVDVNGQIAPRPRSH